MVSPARFRTTLAGSGRRARQRLRATNLRGTHEQDRLLNTCYSATLATVRHARSREVTAVLDRIGTATSSAIRGHPKRPPSGSRPALPARCQTGLGRPPQPVPRTTWGLEVVCTRQPV